MQTKIKKWGNSQGIRLPKRLLDKVGIDDPIEQTIDVEVEDDKIILKKDSQISKFAQRFEDFDLKRYYDENPESPELDWGSDVGYEKLD